MIDEDEDFEPRILCVDDEPRVLEGLRRNLELDFEVFTATSALEGIGILARENIDVVVSDMRMPNIDGAEFLRRVRARWPNRMRILLTGQSDTQAASRAINEGGIHRFLHKPCPAEKLAETVNELLVLQRARAREIEILTTTVSGAIGMLTEVLSVACPLSARRNAIAREVARRIAEAHNLDEEARWNLDVAAQLSGLGDVALPSEVLQRAVLGQALSDDERSLVDRSAEVGAEIIGRIPRFERVAELVRQSKAKLHAASEFEGENADGARLDLALFVAQEHASGKAWPELVGAVRKVSADLANALGPPLDKGGETVRSLRATEIRPGAVLCEDLTTVTGQIVLREGVEISRALAIRISNFAKNVGLNEPIHVRVAA